MKNDIYSVRLETYDEEKLASIFRWALLTVGDGNWNLYWKNKYLIVTFKNLEDKILFELTWS